VSSRAGLVVEGLRVDAVEAGVDIVSEVSFAVAPGTALGIVGESGCGKTTVAMALMGFARLGTTISAGSVRVDEVDVLALTESQLRSMRGRSIAYVPQNPSRALSPGMRVEEQIAEMLEVHVSAKARHQELLAAAWENAQLPTDSTFMRRYPHELSGGQQQRVAIAMALSCEPRVIVMDEPTTGLDVLTQGRLLDVIKELRSRSEISIVYISHDLGVVRNLVDRVGVMYGGRVVEEGPVESIFRTPQHPYTRRLLEAIPRVHRDVGGLRGIPGHAVEPWNRPAGCPFAPRCDYALERAVEEMPPPVTVGEGWNVRCWRVGELPDLDSPAEVDAQPRRRLAVAGGGGTVLEVRGLNAGYGKQRAFGKARLQTLVVKDISFAIERGACLAVVGESGSGKTTLARCLAGLHAPAGGEIEFEGQQLAGLARRRPADVRRRIQIVFQDPDSSLNPSMSVGSILRRPLAQFFTLSRQEETAQIRALLERVHLPPSMAGRLPRQLSGGEKQRVAIARALAAEPELLICDEVTSALDVAVQASILELLEELRRSSGMSMVFVSHDLAVVRTIGDRVLVMHDGELRELADRDELFFNPQADYTKRLLAAVPDLHPGDYPRWDVPAASPMLEEVTR
jgi:peptide/nickel transport system ATP-binding protein